MVRYKRSWTIVLRQLSKGHNMKRSLIALLSSMVLAALVFGGTLAGCSSGAANSINNAQQANRAYMSQVNEIMDEVTGELDEFVQAVSSGDVVSMRSLASNASDALDKISALEAPDELKDIQQSYVDGTTKLKEALDEYIDLYTETESGSFDADTFGDRLDSIQSLYNEGVEALQKGDEDAAAL